MATKMSMGTGEVTVLTWYAIPDFIETYVLPFHEECLDHVDGFYYQGYDTEDPSLALSFHAVSAKLAGEWKKYRVEGTQVALMCPEGAEVRIVNTGFYC